MANNENTRAPAGDDDVIRRLRSLRVVLGIDSPETRGWAPAARQEARRTIDAAIAALSGGSPEPVSGSEGEEEGGER